MTHVPPLTLQPPARDVAELTTRVEALLPAIAAGAAQRERERQLPFDAIAQLAAAGVYTVRIPRRHGGPEGQMRDVIALLLKIAAVDSNVAQALRPGFAFASGAHTSPPPVAGTFAQSSGSLI